MDIDILRRNENNEIIDHVWEIRKIILRKCSRCNSVGCMGCIFNSVDSNMIPSMLDSILDQMGHVPNDRSKIVVAGKRNHRERVSAWQKVAKGENMMNKSFQEHDTGNNSTLRAMRIDIYHQTIKIAQMGQYEVSGKTIELHDSERMMSDTVYYTEPPELGKTEPNQITDVKVIESDTLLSGKKLLDDGFNPAILNFASGSTPGGGVLRGAGAQEENIFRRTNLLLSLYQFHENGAKFNIPMRKEHYPMYWKSGGIYTPEMAIFRGLEADGYPLLEDPYYLSVISVPAVNRPTLKDENHLSDEMVEVTKMKMRSIFRIALLHGHDALVLGAWGCGAFKNPPRHIAQLFQEVLKEDEFRNRLTKIVYAIIDCAQNGNFQAFKEEIRTTEKDNANI